MNYLCSMINTSWKNDLPNWPFQELTHQKKEEKIYEKQK